MLKYNSKFQIWFHSNSELKILFINWRLSVKCSSDVWFISVCSILIYFWLKNIYFFRFSQLLRSLRVKSSSNIWSICVCSLLINFWLKNMNFFRFRQLLRCLTVKSGSNIWSICICSFLINLWFKNMNFFRFSCLLHHPYSALIVDKLWFSLRVTIIRSVSWIVSIWKFRWWLTYNIMPLWKSINIINCCSVYPGIHSIWIYSWVLFFRWWLKKRFRCFWWELISWVCSSGNIKFNKIIDISIDLLITNIL